MNNVLVAYATNAGTTAEVARVIAEELNKNGVPAEAQPISAVKSVESYGAVVIGAPMILGWHRDAARFVRQHQEALSRVPVAYFITAMSLTGASQDSVGPIPVFSDPGLVKPPHVAARLSLKERYTRVSNYASQPLTAGPQVKPAGIGIFGGKLEMYRLKWWQRLFVLLILRAPLGSLQNWPAVRQWAAQLCPMLSEPQRA
jgi:menaquinone-dependent protoporphyrinogen IX oxidase